MSLDIEDPATLERYRRVYSLGADITADHVRRHEALERRLTDELMSSTAETRWTVFESAYTRLFTELPWLNPPVSADALAPDARILSWRHLVPRGAKVYEIGSGRARLLRYLRSIGCDCVATEITRERGERHASAGDGLTWRNSDGIHLTRFELSGEYDCVISTQVVEHMHPDDLLTHFAEARQLLKPGGRYLFDTPHRSAGPADLSMVFALDSARYMHLREYTWIELRELLRQAGYTRIEAVVHLPGLAALGAIACSRFYLHYMMFWDGLEEELGLGNRARQRLRRLLRLALVPSNLWLSATR